MNIKPPAYKTFARIAATTEPDLEEISTKIFDDALAKEVAIAKAKGHVDKDGIPCLTVIVDGGWNKRSYGHGHSASSGAAVVIGAETGLVLAIGSRHRRCKACASGNTSHRCYKDWSGPPGTMEAAILVKCFNDVCERKNVKFTRVVGDDDSSVYRALKDEVTYGYEIEKLNCSNHNGKNLKKAFLKVCYYLKSCFYFLLVIRFRYQIKI